MAPLLSKYRPNPFLYLLKGLVQSAVVAPDLSAAVHGEYIGCPPHRHLATGGIDDFERCKAFLLEDGVHL